ncbi:BTB/POZ domain-containing protein 6-like [Montipora foliosa]|uniref:BTB/POZ domain-containing protein 6-like n=1 Tax=Montipora foliosa TaxID=591990 RepID=UPI0035F1AF73
MSEKGTKPDFWQSTANSTIRERCKYILNQELLSDVKFFVRDHRSEGGSASKPISGHKFVLAISSPVFYAMFYGDMAERGNTVEISDCDYESLMELFRFIYCDEANLTPDNVMQLMYLAKKYMLPSLADKCSTYLQENLDGSNVFNVLPHAQKYEEKGLLDRCWKVIDEETEEAVKSDGFVTIDGSTLEKLVERDTLRIKEVELFRAIDRWAAKECQK